MKYIQYSCVYQKSTLDLLNICFPSKNITSESFFWKYTSDFFQKKEVIFIAVENEKVCSFVSFSPYQDTKLYLCSLQATHPDYRRKGLISTLTKMAKTFCMEREQKDISYLGFSNAEGVKIDKYSKTIGYEICNQAMSVKIPALYYFSELVCISTSLEIVFENQNKYSKEYCNWRYVQNPTKKFYALEIKGVAYVIYTKEKYSLCIQNIFYKNKILSTSLFKALAQYALFEKKIFITYIFMNNLIKHSMFPFLSILKKENIFLTVQNNKSKYGNVEDFDIETADIF